MQLAGTWTPAHRWPGAFAALVLAAAIGMLSWSVRPTPVPSGLASASTAAPAVAPLAASLASRSLGAASLHFERNAGQAPAPVRYLSRRGDAEVLVFDDGVSLAGRSPGAGTRRASVRFLGALPGDIQAREPAAARTHRLVGADPAQWQRDLGRFAQLRRTGLYPGIDLVHYGRDGDYEFDLVVHPGADPSRIRLRIDGPTAPQVDADGALRLDGPDGLLQLKAPVLHQSIDGQRRTMPARWVVARDGTVRFALPDYDRRFPLVIDPVFKLLYSTYLGGVHDDQVGAMVLDAQGNAYVVGHSGSEDWPVSGNAWQTDRKALGTYVRNVVVAKFDAAGTLLWSTFVGGSVNDYARAIALDGKGQVVVAGQTTSPDFPTTADAMQRTLQAGASAFISVLSPDGSQLVHSTLYAGSGGSDANAALVDGSGRLWVAGASGTGLPTTVGSLKPTYTGSGNAAFVARFTPPADGPLRLQAATYYAVDNPPADRFYTGNNVLGFTLAGDGSVWITGQARHELLPTVGTPLTPTPAATDHNAQIGVLPLCAFAYVARLSSGLDALPYASYLTGATREARDRSSCAEYGRSVTVDAAGDIYVSGSTSSDRFPTTTGALQASYPGAGGFVGHVGFVTKFRGDGSAILWSTYVGGNGGDSFVNGHTLDVAAGGVWVYAASASGGNFPVSTDGLQRTHGGGTYDASAVQLDAATGALKYGSFMGGTGNDNAMAVVASPTGGIVVAGTSDSRNFAVTPGAFQPLYTANAFDGSDWFLRVLGAGAISRVLPATGGNAGDVTLRVTGAGFQSGAVCALAGLGQTLAPTQSVVGADGSTMDCSFALVGAPVGAYDLRVMQPDGTTVTRTAAFTVKAGTGSNVNVDVLGRPTIRTGTPAVFDVVVTNDGDADALGVVLFVRYSAGLRPVDPSLPDPFGLDLIPVNAIYPNETGDYSTRSVIMASTAVTGESVVPLFLPLVPAGGSTTFSFKLVAGSGASEEEYVEAEVSTALSDAEGAIAGSRGVAAMRERMLAALPGRARPQGGLDSEACRKALWDYAWDKASGKVPGVDCFRDFQRAIFEAKRYQLTHPSNRGSLMSDIATAAFKSATDCAQLAGIELAVPIEAAKRFMDLLNDAEAAAKIAAACKDDDKEKNKNKKKKKKTKPKGAIDPNDKSGPVGDGSAGRFVKAALPMSYQIAFENLATAGLPAAEVVVTDQLDPARYDLSTLTLGSITWGTHRIDVPPGLSNYSTIHPIDSTVSVRVQGSLDPTTGLLRWTFTTLDPATRLPPSDPTLGFLPPNVNGTQGQGYVNFTVAPKAGAADGTRWENFASIVFDTNAPIVTPTWVNTLDTTAPVGRVTAATQRSGGTDVDVSWGATDAGAGPGSYTVWVSTDGGPFEAWQTDVTTTGAVFTGVADHRYGFYVVATDAAGNREAAKSTAEASVSVTAPGGGGGGGGCTVGGPGQRDASLAMLLLASLVGLMLRRRRDGR